MNLNLILVAVAVILVIAVLGWLYLQKRRQTTAALQQRFGPEYERAVREHGSERKAEANLEDREKRVDKLSIRDLEPAERERYSKQWASVQARFVDSPKGAVVEADDLVSSLMKTRGYPVSDFAQLRTLVSHLKEPYRTMVLFAGCLGLRASEVTGLQWRDINWDDLIIFIRRSVVHGREGETKTEASEKPIPLDPELATEILKHRERSVYVQPTDFVFAGDSGKPRWQETILADHIKPAAAAAKIQGNVGWHTFRHTYSTLLRDLATDIKVQQELLRHADISTTLNVYTQAVSTAKRKAASKAAKALLKDQSKKKTGHGTEVVPTGTF